MSESCHTTFSSSNLGKLFYRIDDVGNACAAEIEFIEHLESLSAPYILAVIPKQLTPEMTRIIGTLSYCTVFQHGYLHKNHLINDYYLANGYMDEFPSERNLGEIQSELMAGKAILENALGRVITGYTPPWNRCSDRAVAILEDLGFSALSAHTRKRYSTSMSILSVSVDPISHYNPLTFRPTIDLQQLIEKSQTERALTGVVYHPAKFPAPYAAELRDHFSTLVSSSVSHDIWPLLQLGQNRSV
jgi:hypothetical protein